MIENIIALSGCIEKEEHVWTRKLLTKYVIIDPRILNLNEFCAAYQLCRVVYDMSSNGNKTSPLICYRCIDNASIKLERFSVIGEPTFNTLLEWVQLYGDRCESKKRIDDWTYNKLIAKRDKYKKTKTSVRENDYEIAFVWFD